MKKIRLATRGSPLALAQAEMAMKFLSSRIVDAEFEIVQVKTRGDKNQSLSLSADGGSGLFTKEIEESLLRGEADIAVHSAKDLPTLINENLRLCGCLPRDVCRDILAIRSDVSVPELIASSSPRRRSQLKKIFPNAVWCELRGNVHTRLEKIVSGYADATVLSEAGLTRLGISEFEKIVFKPVKSDICVPAVGQGIIALECRAEDLDFFKDFSDSTAMDAYLFEREFLKALGGGCQSASAANFDGEVFRFFHENSGVQKIEFPEGASMSEKLKIIADVASALAK